MYNRVLLSGVAIWIAVAWCEVNSQGATGTLADPSGQVVAWGDNSFGQLTVPAGINAASISAGYLHSVELKSDASIAAWGDSSLKKTKAPTAKNFTAISAGGSHSLALKLDGSLAGWGDNTFGQLALPGGKVYVAIAAGGGHNVALKNDGSLVGWGYNTSGEATVPLGNNFAAIATGASHSLALKTDGSLAGWGSNVSGQVTVPAGTNFVAIAGGGQHSVALKSDGSLTGWGDLLGIAGNDFAAVSAGLLHDLALKSDGSLIGWGDNTKGQTTVPVGNFVAISAGGYHNLALVGRTDYSGDLLISGIGVKANINRSVNVAGDLILSSPATFFNNPTATVAGKLRASPGTTLSGNGALVVKGMDLQAGPTGTGFTTGTGVQLVSTGPISGNGPLSISAFSHVDATMGAGSAWSGNLNLALNGAIAFNGTGVQTAGALASGSATTPGPTIVPGGNLTAGAGQRLRFTSTAAPIATSVFPTPNYNGGQVELAGNLDGDGASEIEFVGAITNAAATGLITGRDAVMKFSGGLTNNGAVTLTRGSNDVFGKITNQAGASIVVTGGATATFYDDIVQNGTFRVAKVGSTTSSAVVMGAFTGGGGSTGGGDIFFEGDLRPGNSPASVTFGGNIGLGPAAELDIELAGTTPGSQYDRVNVTGDLALDGALSVTLTDGFVPAAGDTFDILNWGTVGGAFTAISLPAMSGGLAWDSSQLYANGVLSVVSAGLPGDYNNNGVVDANDYIAWRKNQGTTHVLPNDPIGGTIGVAQYEQWRAHIGQSPGSGAALGGTTVPEPASVAAIAMAVAWLGGCRRRLGR